MNNKFLVIYFKKKREREREREREKRKTVKNLGKNDKIKYPKNKRRYL